MIQTCPNFSKLVQTCPNLLKLSKTCLNLFKLVQTCSNFPKLLQTYFYFQGIVQWLEKKTGPPAVPVNDMESFEKLKENPVVVVGVFKDQESDAAKEFIKAAGTIEDHKIVITSDDEVKKGIQARDGWIIMFKNFDNPRVRYEGEAKAAVSLIF